MPCRLCARPLFTNERRDLDLCGICEQLASLRFLRLIWLGLLGPLPWDHRMRIVGPITIPPRRIVV
jgi:hypothetical protein